jgi:hypothetical protein
MPDGSLMVAFTRATGPVDPSHRRLMPEPVLEHDFGLTERRSASPGYTHLDPRRDFWGLRQAVVYLRSTDAGRTWRPWRTDRFRALAPQAYTPQADIALPDGTLIRRLSGYDLRNDPTIPHTALLQTLHFDPASSTPRAAGWSAPRPILHDPSICTYNISRIHQLSDGRLIALGGVWRYASGHSGPCAAQPYSVLLAVASSPRAAERGQWSLGLPYTTQISPNEWDVAELPGGNLLALFRTELGGQPSRVEAILERRGPGWVMTPPRPLPDLPALAPSEHPDLLATRQGAILSFSDSGTAYTFDGGATWTELPFSGDPAFDLHTRYYPYAVQAPDGTIDVFSHDGWDIAYGQYDESIVLDRFRLQIPLRVSQARLSGLVGRRPELGFTVAARRGGPIQTIKVGLPSGLSFTGHADLLKRGVSVTTGDGRRISLSLDTAQLAEGRLLIELGQPVRAASVRMAYPALQVEPVVAAAVGGGRVRTLPVAVKTTDTRGETAAVYLTPPTRP